MREISPAENLSADEFLKIAPAQVQELVSQIRLQKQDGTRPKPSTTLVDRSILLTTPQRARLVDAVANRVDENLFGCAEMCLQFADLLQRALVAFALPAHAVVGRATYYADGQEVFSWRHA